MIVAAISCPHSAMILWSLAICFHCESSSLMRAANTAGVIAAATVPSGSRIVASSGDAEIEETIAAKLRDGETREAAFAAHPRFAHIRRLREQA